MRVRSRRVSSPEMNFDEKGDSVGCGCCMPTHPHLDKYFADITNEATTHGVKYIGSKKLHPIERIFWTIVMLASLGASIYLVLGIWAKYNDTPVIISFQPHETSISQIPFPAVTICNVNLLKTSVIKKLFDNIQDMVTRFELGEKNLRKRIVEDAAHLDHLAQFCMQAESFRRRLNETLQDVNGRSDFMQHANDLIEKLSEADTKDMHQVVRDPSWWREETKLFENASISCEEMLLQCMWAGDMIPCKEIFFSIATRNGHCCVFNIMPQFILQRMSPTERRAQKEIKRIPKKVTQEWKEFARENLIIKNMSKVQTIKYPKHQKAGGKPYGLTVLVNPNLQEYSTCNANDGWGFKMVAHSPLSSPSIMDYGVAVPSNSEVLVDIEPRITVAERDLLKNIPILKRGCYLQCDPEARLHRFNYYSIENCVSECFANHTYLNCSCVRYYMPRNVSQRICGAKDRACFEEVHANFTKSFGKNSYCSHCLPSCTEVLYKLQLSHSELRKDNASSFVTYSDTNGVEQTATNYSILHIYMGTESIYAKERKALYEWSDFVANAGGLLSLTLGVSIISFIEIGYFFSIRAWFEYRSVTKKEDKNGQEGQREGQVFSNTRRKIGRRKSSVMFLTKKSESDGYYDWNVRNKLSVSNSSGGVGFTKRKGIAKGKLPLIF